MSKIIYGGTAVSNAEKALVLIHGRGSTAEDIMGLSKYLNISGFALVAPQASGNTWYPYSFLQNRSDNEPALSKSLQTIDIIVDDLKSNGFIERNIYFAGFSQGACLTLEYTTINAARFGGVVAFTGGLIGNALDRTKYTGNFAGTPVLITTGNPDSHVPLTRIKESVEIIKAMGAAVRLKISENKPHSISQPEIDLANQYIFDL